MAKNEFKPFATAENANVTSQSEWEALPVTATGFQSGKASSAQINKALRQSSFVSSSVAQFISDMLSQDVIDNGDRQAFVAAFRQSIVNGSVPAGIPMPWPTTTPPEGWLKCNGASFDLATYPLLAKAYPSGVLPDLRGEFIRGWDDGRGVDLGRKIFTNQTDEFRSHNHRIINEYNTPSDDFVAFTDQNSEGVECTLSSGARAWTYIKLEKSGGVETRPRNIAFNYIVRAA